MSFNYEETYSSGSGVVGSVSGVQSFSGHSVHNDSVNTVNQIAIDLLHLQGSRSGSVQASQFASGASLSGGQSISGAGFSAASLNEAASLSGRASFNDRVSVNAGGSASSASFSFSGSSATVLSNIEQAILRSTAPIDINESEEISVNFAGSEQRGIWANKSEIVNWRGEIPITQYLINEDANPEVITKRSEQKVVYIQELAIRYLRPPTPPAPGEIVITQEINSMTAPAPPLVIRQQPPRAATPEALIIREAPPEAPAAVGRKVITISGKRIPPAPRKVVIERLAALPAKPQSVLVERWLPYAQTKRRVIFQRSNERDAVVVKPRNVIVQWEAPKVDIKKEFKYLGIIRANPVEYVTRYGSTLLNVREMPSFVHEFKAPDGLVLAADYQQASIHELEGDVKALQLVDLEREGLSQYSAYLSKLGLSYVGASNVLSAASQLQSNNSFSVSGGSRLTSASGHVSAASVLASAASGLASAASGLASSSFGASYNSSSSRISGNFNQVISEIFASIDTNSNGLLSLDEASRVLMRLNSQLGRNYTEQDSSSFLQSLDVNGDGELSISEFRRAFENLLN